MTERTAREESFGRFFRTADGQDARARVWETPKEATEALHSTLSPLPRGLDVLGGFTDFGGYHETEGWTASKSNLLVEMPRAGRGATLQDDTWTEEKSDAGAVPEGEPRHLGPFALAYLEALVRIADWRASERPSAKVRPSETHCDAFAEAGSATREEP